MEIYKLNDGPYYQNDYLHWIKLDNPQWPEIWSFKYCHIPITGVGPQSKKFLYFDDYIDKRLLPELKKEVAAATGRNLLHWKKIIANGIVPTHVNSGQKCIDSYMSHLDKYARDTTWKDVVPKLKKKRDIKMYFHQYFNIDEAWDGQAMLRKYSEDYMAKAKESEWLGCIQSMPALKEFAEKLPFKYIGYAQIFKSKKDHPVLVHRDYFPVNHQVHFINIRLDQKPRPFFLYDATTNRKEYIDQSSDAYFFNETDLHGIDAEEESGMTLRIEGQFADWFQKEIGLWGHNTFDWNYELGKDILNNKKYGIVHETDI